MLINKPFDIKSGMVYLPGGTFLMGSAREEVDLALSELTDKDSWYADQMRSEYPKHDVYLSPFYIDKYEVTQAEFIRVMGYNPSLNKHDLNNPVDSVSKEDALEYCRRTNKRLPTEAEWNMRPAAAQIRGFSGETARTEPANMHGMLKIPVWCLILSG